MADVPAESSPAPEPVVIDQAAFKAAHLAELAGKPIPEPPPAAVSEAAEPAEQVASTDASPAASEPAKPKNNANTRIRELVEENKRLASELESFKKPAPDVKRADPSPATPKKDYERYMEAPEAPKFEAFDTIEAFVAAAAAHVIEARDREREQQQHAKQKADSFTSMKDKGVAAFQDFDEVLGEADRSGLQWPEPIVQLIFSHERGHEIAYLLAKERIADPVKAGMAIAGLLAEKTDVEHQPVPKTTKAPIPPRTLGQRQADPGDPEMAAVRSGDQARVKALHIAEMAAQRGV